MSAPGPQHRDLLIEAIADVLLDEERGDFGMKPERAFIAAVIAAETEKHEGDEVRRLRAEVERLKAEALSASREERHARDELHGCWECGTSDMRANVCAEHERYRAPASREEGA